MKKYIIFVVVVCYILHAKGMELADLTKKPEFLGVIVESDSDRDYVQSVPTIDNNRLGCKIEPKSLTEMKQVVRERSQKNELPARRKTDPQSESRVTERSHGITESTSDLSLASSKKSAPRRLKNFVSPRRSHEELKNSRGEAKVVPRTVSDVQRIVKNRSVRSEPVARFKRQEIPIFSREQLENIHQNRQSRKLYTEEDVQNMVAEQDHYKKARQSKKLYTEEEVAAILQQASCDFTPLISSRFREYGQQYNIPLQELPQYAQLLDDIVITPRLLAEYIYQKHGTNNKPESYEIKAYEKLSKHDPAHYEKLVFGILKEILNEADDNGGEQNQTLPREFVDTHVRLLQHEIGSQTDDIFQYRVAVVVKFLALVGTTAWALYGQISQSMATTSCSNSTTG